MVKSPVQPPPKTQSVSEEYAWKRFCTKLLTRLLSFVDVGFKCMSAQLESLDHQMEFQIIFQTVTFCQFVLYVSQETEAFHRFSPPLF